MLEQKPDIEEVRKRISEVLVDIEYCLHELAKPNFTTDGFLAATRIIAVAMLDKIDDLAEEENMNKEHRQQMADKMIEDIAKIVKTYANIDVLKK